MPRVFARLTFTLAAALTLMLLLLRGAFGVLAEAPPRLDLFAGCDAPCWRGLHLGSSTMPELYRFFATRDMPVHTREINRGRDQHPNYYLYVENEDVDVSVVFNGEQQRVVAIAVNRPGCPAHLISTYGVPQRIITNTWVYWLMYPKHNILVALPTGLNDAVTPKEGYYITLVPDEAFRVPDDWQTVRWNTLRQRIMGYPCA